MSTQDRQADKSPLAPLHRLEFILQHKSDNLLRASLGMGFGHLRIMEGLSPTRACSQRILARQLYQTEANISRQLQLMKAKGLVSIERDPKDKRQRRVRLSVKGSAARTKAQKLLSKLHKDILGAVDYRDAYNFTEIAEKLAASATFDKQQQSFKNY